MKKIQHARWYHNFSKKSKPAALLATKYTEIRRLFSRSTLGQGIVKKTNLNCKIIFLCVAAQIAAQKTFVDWWFQDSKKILGSI